MTSLISRTLESLSDDDPNSFEPISILMLPSMDNHYTSVTNKSDRSCYGGSTDPPSFANRGSVQFSQES